jgi:hypothetical protein
VTSDPARASTNALLLSRLGDAATLLDAVGIEGAHLFGSSRGLALARSPSTGSRLPSRRAVCLSLEFPLSAVMKAFRED